MRRSLIVSLAMAVLVGCGGGDAASSTTEKRSVEAFYTEQEASTSSNAKAVCGFFPQRRIASQLGIEDAMPSASAVARAYSQTVGKALRNAAYEGCITGLLVKPIPRP